jgi:hypothetical protein
MSGSSFSSLDSRTPESLLSNSELLDQIATSQVVGINVRVAGETHPFPCPLFTFFRNHKMNDPTRTADRPPIGIGNMWPNAAKPVRHTNTVTPPPTMIKMYATTSKQPTIRLTSPSALF